MDVGRVGIWSPELRLGPAGAVGDAATELEELGFTTVWLPGLDGTRILDDVETVLTATRTAVVATGVMGIWGLPAGQVAAEHARLQARHGERFLLGLGTSSAEMARRHGQTSFHPLADMDAYLDALDTASPPVQAHSRVLAALGPRMSRLGAKRCVGVHPFLVGADYCHVLRNLLGPGPLLAHYLPTALISDPERARNAIREWLARFLTMPSYRASLRRQGFTDTDLAEGGSDRLIDAVSAWGELDAIATRLRAYRDAGADHVALHVLGAASTFPRAQWRELAHLTTFRESSDMALRTIAGDPLARPGISRAKLEVPEATIEELHRRLDQMRWPDRETVAGTAQGVPLDRMRQLIDHWRTRYDWRRFETLLNDLGHYRTVLDGLAIHFLHVRSPHPDATPLLLTHGWPGSIVEFVRALSPLTDPTAHGGDARDAFHVVAPSLPGFGFSGKPTASGWTATRIAGAWAQLMDLLGYRRYLAQGGDWGGAVTHALGVLAPKGLAGIHLNFPPFLFSPPLGPGEPDEQERRALDRLDTFQRLGAGYHRLQSTRPQTIGYGLTDSPAGLAAWIYEKFDEWTDTDHQPEQVLPLDLILDNIMLYWLPAAGASSARLYWQHEGLDMSGPPPTLPVGISAFPGEIVPIPRVWAERVYPQVVYFNAVERGGHFAAFEQPELFTREVRAFARHLPG
jgi:epoxide hydrolase